MSGHLLKFCQVVLSTFAGILVFVLITGLAELQSTSLVYRLGLAGAFIVTIVLMVCIDKIITSRLSLSMLDVLSRKQKMNWIGKHPNLLGVGLVYSVVAIVGAIVARIVIAEAKESGNGSQLASLWTTFFAGEGALLTAALLLAFLLDRYQLREKISANTSAVTVNVASNKVLLASLALSSLCLYALFFPLYIQPAIGKMVFEVTASSQTKLNCEFAHELNILTVTGHDYNKNIIYDYVGRGADVNTTGKNGPPLSFAARAGDAEFVKDLLTKGADVKKCSASEQESIEKLTKISSASSAAD